MVAGNIAEIAAAKQSAKGSVATAAAYRTLLMGGNFGPMRENGVYEETSGDRMLSDGYLSIARSEGAPLIAVMPKSIGFFLWAALGSDVITGAGDPYLHTITPALIQPYITLWRMNSQLEWERHVDCKVSSLRLESTAGQPLVATVGALGITAQAKTSAAYATEVAVAVEKTDRMKHYDGRGAFTFEGVVVSSIRRQALQINLGVTAEQGDSHVPDAIEEGRVEITWEIEHRVVDYALWNRAHWGAATPADNTGPSSELLELGAGGIDIKFTRVAAAPGPERSLQLQASRLSVDSMAQDPNVDGSSLYRTVTYRLWKPTSGAAITALVKNPVATAYGA